MKKFIIMLATAASVIAASAQQPRVQWSTLGNEDTPDKRGKHVERLVLDGHKDIARLCFNRFARRMTPVDPRDTIAEIIPGYYYISSPRFGESTGPLTIDITLDMPLQSVAYRPDGFHAVMRDGSVVPVRFSRASITSAPGLYASSRRDPMPRGTDIFRLNDSLRGDYAVKPYDFIPSFKRVDYAPGEALCPVNTPVTEHPSADPRDDYYRIIINPDTITLRYTSPQSLLMARRVLREKIIPANLAGLPAGVIEDWPSLGYRGMMMDVSRNFFNAAQVQQIVHLLASYRLNTLHFHITDDEAWRLEIPGLPELTEVGSRRGYTTGEDGYLAQLFNGDGNPDNYNGTANGFITRQEFVDLLKYCNSLGITVIPELESPGHARAAIRSMMAYEKRTGDSSYRLHDVTDSSAYTSAQAFHDNIMNPALPGPYKFMTHVIDAVIDMYREAGVELRGIHIGGDEVPAKAWDGSPAIRRMLAERGLKESRDAHAVFVDSIASILAARNVPLYAWQDIAVRRPDSFNAKVAPLCGGINCWTNVAGGVADKVVDAGYPAIICNVDHYYLDQTYNSHPDEPGLSWGGLVDEFAMFNGYPDRLCHPADKAGGGNIVGVSCHLWGETLRCLDDVYYLMLPKMLGMAERGWNAQPSLTPQQFNAIVGERELPALALRGHRFHVRQPGIVIADGIATMNAPYRGGTIRYTLDGTEPTEQSPAYTTPVTVPRGATVKARYYYLGQSSLTTIP